MSNLVQAHDSWIPLESIASSTYAPSNLETNSIDTDNDIACETTTVGIPLNPNFSATRLLQIQAQGKHLPTTIQTPRDAHLQPVYICIRSQRRSGNCKLVDAEDPTATAIARTTYRFGPGHNPVVRIGRDDEADLDVEEFEMVGTSLLTRTVGFETRSWGKFQWRYGNKDEKKQFAADNLLILEKIVDGHGSLRVAQLVRNEVLRTPGTSYHTAGNGGRLQMDIGLEVRETVIVMTCLVMLKKEVDRLRTIQIIAMSGAGGS